MRLTSIISHRNLFHQSSSSKRSSSLFLRKIDILYFPEDDFIHLHRFSSLRNFRTSSIVLKNKFKNLRFFATNNEQNESSSSSIPISKTKRVLQDLQKTSSNSSPSSSNENNATDTATSTKTSKTNSTSKIGKEFNSSSLPSFTTKNNKSTRKNESKEGLLDFIKNDPAIRVTVLGSIANLGLSGLKGILGIITGSASLIADAVHSLSDLATDAVTLITLRFSIKPKDDTHPYGYMRYEPIGTFCVSGFICIAGLGIGYDAIGTMSSILEQASLSSETTQNALSLAVDSSSNNITGEHMFSGLNSEMFPLAMSGVIISFLVKEYLYRITVKIGKDNNSSVLIANAWHHRSDALSSGVAAIGIIGTGYFNFPLADPLGGVLVAGMVFKTGLELGMDAIQELADKNIASIQLKNEIIKYTHQASLDILSIDSIRIRKVGNCYFVDLIVGVSSRLSLTGFEKAQKLIIKRIKNKINDVAEINISYNIVNNSLTIKNFNNSFRNNNVMKNGKDEKENQENNVVVGENNANSITNDTQYRKIQTNDQNFKEDDIDNFHSRTISTIQDERSVLELQNSLKHFIESSIDDVKLVRQIDIHYLSNNNISVEMVIVSDLPLLKDIKIQAKKIQKLITSEICDLCTGAIISNVEVRLELSDGCHLISGDVKRLS